MKKLTVLIISIMSVIGMNAQVSDNPDTLVVARNVYRTIITMKSKFKGAAMDSKPKAQKPGRLSSILGNINKE